MTTPVTDTEQAAETVEQVDISDFLSAVNAYIEAYALEPSADHAKTDNDCRIAYTALDPEGRSMARKYVDEAAQQFVMAGKLVEAQAMFPLRDSIRKPPRKVRTGPASARRSTVNPTEAFVSLVASVRLAYALAFTSSGSVTGLADDWQEQIDALATEEAQGRAAEYRAWVDSGMSTEEPHATDVEKAAARVSLGRAAKGQGRRPKTAVAVESATEADGSSEGSSDSAPADGE